MKKAKLILATAVAAFALTGCFTQKGLAIDPMASAPKGTPEHKEFCVNRLQNKDNLAFFSRLGDLATAGIGVIGGAASTFTLGVVKDGVSESLDNTTTAYYSASCKEVWDEIEKMRLTGTAFETE